MTRDRDPLYRHLPDLLVLSAGMIRLTEICPERLTTGQAGFFLAAAIADIAGKPATFTDIRDVQGEAMNRSLHTTYKIFLEGNRRNSDGSRRPGLKWLTAEEDPTDARRKYLKLTKAGRLMVEIVAKDMIGEKHEHAQAKS